MNVVLSGHYQCRFSEVVDSQEAEFNRGVLISDISQNKINPNHSASFSIALQYSIKRLCACAYLNFQMGFKRQERWISSLDTTLPHSNSSFQEIHDFEDMALCNMKLGKLVLKLLKKNYFFF